MSIRKWYGGPADAVRWELEIEEHLGSVETFGGRAQFAIMTAPTEARLTLHDVTKPECEAILALVNQMRGKVPEPAALPPGGRFANLDFE